MWPAPPPAAAAAPPRPGAAAAAGGAAARGGSAAAPPTARRSPPERRRCWPQQHPSRPGPALRGGRGGSNGDDDASVWCSGTSGAQDAVSYLGANTPRVPGDYVLCGVVTSARRIESGPVRKRDTHTSAMPPAAVAACTAARPTARVPRVPPCPTVDEQQVHPQADRHGCRRARQRRARVLEAPEHTRGNEGQQRGGHGQGPDVQVAGRLAGNQLLRGVKRCRGQEGEGRAAVGPLRRAHSGGAEMLEPSS